MAKVKTHITIARALQICERSVHVPGVHVPVKLIGRINFPEDVLIILVEIKYPATSKMPRTMYERRLEVFVGPTRASSIIVDSWFEDER